MTILIEKSPAFIILSFYFLQIFQRFFLFDVGNIIVRIFNLNFLHSFQISLINFPWDFLESH